MSESTITYTSSALPPELDAKFEGALAAVAASVSHHQLFIDGVRLEGGGAMASPENPSRTGESLGTFSTASPADVDRAVTAAVLAGESWRRRSWRERAVYLRRLADLIDEHSGALAAILTLEVGKNRIESLGEVDECSALIREYVRQIESANGFDVALAGQSGTETSASIHRPFGVFGVIAPFNFPLALVVGPSAAALLSGNTVVVKPSPTTMWATSYLADLVVASGLPSGVFNIIPGGDDVGRVLVDHPSLGGLVFTGSYAAGQAIHSRFALAAGYARPCFAEMGGKNTAIVAASANIDDAAMGIARSAFGLSGQKCSACSRVLVEGSVHDALVEALVAQARTWHVGDASASESRLGPVHTESSAARFQRLVGMARVDGCVAFGGARLHEIDGHEGHYVEPTVVTDLPLGHDLARDEHFLPFVTVQRVESVREAVDIGNDQVYGLTAGLFSRDDDEIAYFLDNMQTGTLFVNRAAGATNGGWPGATTFVGWKGSGTTGRGALGPFYAQQFGREQNHTRVP